MVNFGLSHDAWGRLVLVDADGVRHVGVESVRAFPISDPEHWITICDDHGRELVTIENIESLPDDVRQVLQHDLGRREFMPVIQRVVGISTDADPAEWDVQTDKGETRFTLASEDDIRRLGPHKVLVIDTQGIRYLIPDTRQLDAASRRSLERYL